MRIALVLALTSMVLSVPTLGRAGQEGVLEVRSNVDGSVVYLDNVLRGPAPLVEVVSAGYHDVRVTHPSFSLMERQVLVAADTSVSVSAELERIRPGLSIRVDVPGARVFLDGEQIGVGDVILDPVRAGRHRLVVETDEFGRYARQLMLADRTMTPVEVNIRASQGALVVTSDPAGARLLLDGRDAGTTPSTITPLRPGNHVFKLVSEGRTTGFGQVTVEAGAESQVHMVLPAAGGKLDIQVRPSAARVFLSGVLLGEGSQRLANVVPGSYSVRATAPGHMDFLQSAEVTVGKTTRLQARMRSFEVASGGGPRPFERGQSGVPIHKRPAFWVGVSAGGAAVLVAIIAGGIQAAGEDPGSEPVPGTPAPAATYTFVLP